MILDHDGRSWTGTDAAEPVALHDDPPDADEQDDGSAGVGLDTGTFTLHGPPRMALQAAAVVAASCLVGLAVYVLVQALFGSGIGGVGGPDADDERAGLSQIQPGPAQPDGPPGDARTGSRRTTASGGSADAAIDAAGTEALAATASDLAAGGGIGGTGLPASPARTGAALGEPVSTGARSPDGAARASGPADPPRAGDGAGSGPAGPGTGTGAAGGTGAGSVTGRSGPTGSGGAPVQGAGGPTAGDAGSSPAGSSTGAGSGAPAPAGPSAGPSPAPSSPTTAGSSDPGPDTSPPVPPTSAAVPPGPTVPPTSPTAPPTTVPPPTTVTTTTDPTTSTIAAPPMPFSLIASPADGASSPWRTPTRFRANAVPGADRYCWTLQPAVGSAVERCRGGTNYVLPARPPGVPPGPVTVTARALDPAGQPLLTQQLAITLTG